MRCREKYQRIVVKGHGQLIDNGRLDRLFHGARKIERSQGRRLSASRSKITVGPMRE
jgi:hypothetical protein